MHKGWRPDVFNFSEGQKKKKEINLKHKFKLNMRQILHLVY